MTSYVALITDLFIFAVMPTIGGILMTSVNHNFDMDPITYVNADITKADMYASQMRLIKTTIYSTIGKPYFFEESQSSY